MRETPGTGSHIQAERQYMKSKLEPHNERLWQLALRDLPKFIAGKPSSYRKVTLTPTATKKEVVAARKSIHATQKRFAEVMGVSVETVKSWEAGRRLPEGPASKAIRLIKKSRHFAEVFEDA
jgi:DNA-binding transcriptional regulator YiaG